MRLRLLRLKVPRALGLLWRVSFIRTVSRLIQGLRKYSAASRRPGIGFAGSAVADRLRSSAKLAVKLVAFFAAADDLIDELLGNGPAVVHRPGGFQDRLQLLRAVQLQAVHEAQKLFHVAHLRLDVEAPVAGAEVIVEVGGQIVLAAEGRVFALQAGVAGGLQALQGDLSGEDQAVELIQDGQLLVGESAPCMGL